MVWIQTILLDLAPTTLARSTRLRTSLVPVCHGMKSSSGRLAVRGQRVFHHLVIIRCRSPDWASQLPCICLLRLRSELRLPALTTIPKLTMRCSRRLQNHGRSTEQLRERAFSTCPPVALLVQQSFCYRGRSRPLAAQGRKRRKKSLSVLPHQSTPWLRGGTQRIPWTTPKTSARRCMARSRQWDDRRVQDTNEPNAQSPEDGMRSPGPQFKLSENATIS
mmetsp:Transcript_25359/g.45941  ORF Transcript_25359/g.45941 Transcript_25359/m.45941 type:complete len:220 (+) Transcript_25359:1275-1934(+)